VHHHDRRAGHRACRTGILFVVRTGMPWQMVPQDLGCGSGMTCWRRLCAWQQASVWELIHFALLYWLATARLIDRGRGRQQITTALSGYGQGPTPI
jgi:transposase